MTLHAGMDTPMQREHEKELISAQAEGIAALVERIKELEAHIDQFKKAADFECYSIMDADSSKMVAVKTTDVRNLKGLIHAASAPSLAAVRREAMGEMREKIAGALIDANMPSMTHVQVAQVIREVKTDD